jgi:hypothetical protein
MSKMAEKARTGPIKIKIPDMKAQPDFDAVNKLK